MSTQEEIEDLKKSIILIMQETNKNSVKIRELFEIVKKMKEYTDEEVSDKNDKLDQIIKELTKRTELPKKPIEELKYIG